MTFKSDASIMREAANLHDELVAQLAGKIPDDDFKSQCIFQPLPRSFAAGSDNVLGIERHADDGILWGAHVMVRTPELEAWAYPRVRLLYEKLRSHADGRGALLPWITANYAHPTQPQLESYGEENLGRMREAAAKYDPDGVFQTLCPGGFKISAVRSRGGDRREGEM